MNILDSAMREFGIFFFNDDLAFGISIWNCLGDQTSIFNFKDKKSAKAFFSHFNVDDHQVFINGRQVVFFGEYTEAIKHIPSDLLEFCQFSRGSLY
jgi:hypothetical protein